MNLYFWILTLVYLMHFLKSLLFCSFCNVFFCQSINQQVLHEANKYEGGGYYWDGTGLIKPIIYKDSIFLEKGDTGSFCSGFTLMIAFDVLHFNNKLNQKIMSRFYNFYRTWYGVPAISRDKQCVLALTKYNLGFEVNIEEAIPGDFVQFWRNNKSGHSVIFLGWERNEKNEIVGMHYRSSQKLTFGVGDRCEFIGDHEDYINVNRIYISRLIE